MPSKTFILGAGFSASAGFPLVRALRHELLSFIETEQHPSAKPHLTPNVHGHPQGQFYAGLEAIDPRGSMGLEELMIALRDRLAATHDHDPCYNCERILRDACGRLLWQKQAALRVLPVAYTNFGSWFHEHHGNGQPNAIISFNWDLLAERALTDARVCWAYTAQLPWVPILKPHGSINWSDHCEKNLLAASMWKPISPQSTYSYIPTAPLSDPFENGVNQRLRKLFLPGDPEGAGGSKLVWEEAEASIRERDTVVFIGYSLPHYDEHATEFFRRTTAGKQIEVYARSAETLEHYRRLLGHISTTKPMGFTDCPYAHEKIRVASRPAV